MNSPVVINFMFSRPRNPWVVPTAMDIKFFTTTISGSTFSFSCAQTISRLEFRESIPTWWPQSPAAFVSTSAHGTAWVTPMHDYVCSHAITERRKAGKATARDQCVRQWIYHVVLEGRPMKQVDHWVPGRFRSEGLGGTRD